MSYDTGAGTSFFLHNPHGLPELRNEKKEAHFSPKRTLQVTGSTLDVTYATPSLTNSVVSNSVTDRAIQPNHPVDGDAWTPPFLYDDPRNAFIVRTEETTVWMREWLGLGIVDLSASPTASIPNLVVPPARSIPDPVGPIMRQPGFGLVDPSPAERFVTEDAYITKALGTRGTVQFGGIEIGIAGSQVKSVRTR